MSTVILSCTTLLEYVQQAQKVCNTDFPVIELEWQYHIEPSKMKEHILQTLSCLASDVDTVLVAMEFCGGSWQDVSCRELLGNKLPEHLIQGGIPPFSGWVHTTNTACFFCYAATFIILGCFSPVTDICFFFPDTERYFLRILKAPTASALYFSFPATYNPRSFRLAGSAYLFDTSGDSGLH